MSDTEIIKSYLVSLKASTDKASFDKFAATLAGTEKTVAGSVSHMLADLLKFQVGATTAFATAGFGLIGYIDKLGMSDLALKRHALQNMMSVQQYRQVASALDVLGLSLDDVFHGTLEDQKAFSMMASHVGDLEKMLGPGYEDQMFAVRDVIRQFKLLELDFQFFGMKFVSDLLGKLGMGNGALLGQLEHLNDFVTKNMPRWADELSTDVVPIFHDFWDIMKGLGIVAEDAGLEFSNLVGLFSGDTSLEGTTFSFHKFAQALEKVAHWTAKIVEGMEKVEDVLLHIAPLIVGLLGGGTVGGVTGSILGGIAGIPGGPLGILAGMAAGGATGTGIGATVGGIGGGIVTGAEEVDRYLHSSASQKTVDFSQLVHGIAMVESGGSQYNRDGSVKIGPSNPSGELAIGMMQLLPSTARKLGVNPYDPAQNLAGGTQLIARLINQHHGDYEGALAAYGGAASQYSPQGQAYIHKVERVAGITVGSIVVNVPNTSHSPEMIAHAVKQGVRDGLNEHTQRLMVETAGAYQ